MPSPFPGMDPYLEDPGLWPDVHHELISGARQALNAQLRPKYYVRLEERVFISEEDDPGRYMIVPDLRVARTPRPGRSVPTRSGGGAAIAEPVEVVALLDEEIHEARIEIVDRDRGQVVTVIEVLSPSNKVSGARGRESYLQKRREVMRSPSHWVEIDLLRAGASAIGRQALGPHDYVVHMSRAEKRPRGYAWPIRLQDRLPVIGIPLRNDDPDVPLDLQALLDEAYGRAGYDLIVDYAGTPVPPLTAEQSEWARGVLAAKGLIS